MCNAWNHPPGCTCGWGGDGHLGKGGGGRHTSDKKDFSANPRKTITRKTILSFDSFVNPTATCPVCGEQVFFYKSPDGGKVFFDALGPPWPKHQCTDNGLVSKRSVENIIEPKRKLEWQVNGWTPFIVSNIARFNNKVILITGRPEHQDYDIDIFVKKTKVVPTNLSRTLFHIKQTDNQTFDISTFNFVSNKNMSIQEIRLVGYKKISHLATDNTTRIWSKYHLDEYGTTAEYEGKDIIVGYAGNHFLRNSVAHFNLYWLIYPWIDECLNWQGEPMEMPMGNAPVHEAIEEALKIVIAGETVEYWAMTLTAEQFVEFVLSRCDLPFMSELFSRDLFYDDWVARAKGKLYQPSTVNAKKRSDNVIAIGSKEKNKK